MIRSSPRRIALLSTLLMVAISGQLAGQTAAPSTPPLTLADVLRIARERQPAFIAASARRQLMTAQARQDATLSNPVVEWRRENSGGDAADAFLTVAQPIDITGRRLALRSATSAVDRQALADSATLIRVAEADGVRAYWRASLARALLTIASEQRIDAERLATTDSMRALEGAIAEVASMRATLEAHRMRLAEASAAADWSRSRGELARALALPADSLPDLPALTPARDVDRIAPSVDTILAKARTTRSELTAAQAAQDVARLRERAATLGILGDITVEAGQKHTANQNLGVLALALPVPLWNRNGPARSIATAERRLAESNLRAANASVSADVIASVGAYRALLAARPTDATPLADRANEVARIAEAAYADGGATLTELLDARRARGDALAALLRWSADLRLAELDIVRAAGLPFTDLLELP